MNLLQRLRMATALIFGQYESGQRWSSRRSNLRGFVQDARFDADAMTRLEIVRKSRYFERNNAIVNRLADLFEQYTVGAHGLQFVPASSDEDWNRAASAWFAEWSRFCDLASRQSFGTLQSLCARSWLVDGEIFLLKTAGRGRLRVDATGREIEVSFPRVQLIESHRVETPANAAADARIVDGVQVDERGRPTGYWVRQGTFSAGPFNFMGDDRFEFIPADRMIHIFEPSRPGMYRGLPFGYAVLNDLHDLDDLQLLEMDAAKDAASITNVVKTKTGELPMEDLLRSRVIKGGATKTGGTSGGSSQQRDDYYRESFGGRTVTLRANDDFAQFRSDRPSVAVQAYWEHLISKVCAGYGISKLLVFPHSMQGTVTRADLDVANAFFRSRSAVLASHFSEVWWYVMDWAGKNVRDLSDPPADWRRVNVRPPRSVNVDVGRNANALIAEYQAGWRTLEGICGELGEDFREVLEQRARELQVAQKLETQYNLPPGSLIESSLAAIKQNQPAPKPETIPEPAAA